MDTLSYKTVSLNKATVKKEWVLVDATDHVVGRLASKVAKILRGKYKPGFTPHVDCGDNVIVINAAKMHFSGNKDDDKKYFLHSDYPGSQRRINPKELKSKNEKAILEWAVKGMLPKNKLADRVIRNLHVYAGAEHNQEAQMPKQIDLNSIK